MEIYLKVNDKQVRLPILPSNFERQTSASVSTSKVVGLGDVAMFNGNGLSKITLESFFPNRAYSFNTYSPVPKPYDMIHILKEAKNKGIPTRLIITGTDINQLMLITDLNYGEQDSTGDVYYTIDLIEYRNISIKNLTSGTTTGTTTGTTRPTDPSTGSNTTKTYKVVKGDCLWNIAKKFYGKGSLYTKIQNANISKYPSLKKNPSRIYPGWELVIP